MILLSRNLANNNGKRSMPGNRGDSETAQSEKKKKK